MEEITKNDLEEIVGGRKVPSQIRATCLNCKHVFETKYARIIKCPNCGKELPLFDGFKFRVLVWLDK